MGSKQLGKISQPAIAQLAEHLTVESCSHQMVPGSIPGGRSFPQYLGPKNFAEIVVASTAMVLMMWSTCIVIFGHCQNCVVQLFIGCHNICSCIILIGHFCWAPRAAWDALQWLHWLPIIYILMCSPNRSRSPGSQRCVGRPFIDCTGCPLYIFLCVILIGHVRCAPRAAWEALH